EPMERAARWRHPLRVRVAGEERCLLSVRSERTHDDQVDSGRLRSPLHAVEGERGVRPHRLALAVCERTPVLAVPAGHGEERAATGRGQPCLGVRANAQSPLAGSATRWARPRAPSAWPREARIRVSATSAAMAPSIRSADWPRSSLSRLAPARLTAPPPGIARRAPRWAPRTVRAPRDRPARAAPP